MFVIASDRRERSNLFFNRLLRRPAGLLAMTFFSLVFPAPTPAAEEKPALIVFIVIDGLPARQFTAALNFFGEGGFRRLIEDGAWIPAARYRYASTVTAPGHATLVTGQQPARHGVVGNEWYDSRAGRIVYSTEDGEYPILDELPKPRRSGASPRNLMRPAFGDWLKTNGYSRVFAASMKDRAAVIMAGQGGTAYFYSAVSGRFISSAYYMQDFPPWLKNYHASKIQDRWFGKYWNPEFGEKFWEHAAQPPREQHMDSRGLGKQFPHRVTGRLSAPGASYYAALARTPYADEYLADFVKRLVREEDLGQNPAGVPDVLAVSFSAHDYINHHYGPESLESLDHLLRLDRILADLLKFLEQEAGTGKVIAVLSADHGFAETPEYCTWTGRPAGRIDGVKLVKRLNRHLARKFGNGIYIAAWTYPELSLSDRAIERSGRGPRQIEMEAQRFIAQWDGIEKVYSQTAIEEAPDDSAFENVVRAGRYPGRSGNLFLVPRECWFMLNAPKQMAANHGTPHACDAEVPLIFWGQPFKPGRYDMTADPADAVPTLAAALGAKNEMESDGRALDALLN